MMSPSGKSQTKNIHTSRYKENASQCIQNCLIPSKFKLNSKSVRRLVRRINGFKTVTCEKVHEVNWKPQGGNAVHYQGSLV